MSARKPLELEPLRIHGSIVAKPNRYGNGRRDIEMTLGGCYEAATLTLMTAWLTKAAAWCREGSK